MKKIQETSIIEDSSVAFEKVNKILFSAEKEVLVLTSSKGVIRLWENKVLLKNFQEKGIRLKIIAPITSENLEPARELSKHFNEKITAGYVNEFDDDNELADWNIMFDSKNEDTYGYFDIYVLKMRRVGFDGADFLVTEVGYEFDS